MADITTASMVLASFVLLIAVALTWNEWRDRRTRLEDPSPEDARHFARQDSRRTTGIVVLGLLAIGVVIGSRVPPKVGGDANPQFLGTWLGVFALIFVLLTLAMRDWIALRRFALRHRGEILRERIEILRDEALRRQELREPTNGDGNGHGEGPLTDLFR